MFTTLYRLSLDLSKTGRVLTLVRSKAYPHADLTESACDCFHKQNEPTFIQKRR